MLRDAATFASGRFHDEAGRLVARYGPWTVDTSLDNVTAAEISGPYAIPKTIGPAHLSFADHGLTFASNPHQGVCISFREPVTGLTPSKRMRHPGLTVTVADCAGLVRALNART